MGGSFLFKYRYVMLIFALVMSFPALCVCQQAAEPELVMRGDYDGDGVYSFVDVDILTESGIIGERGYLPDDDTRKFDLDLDGLVTQLDIFLLVGLIEVVDDANPGITPQNCVPGDITFDGLVDTLDVNHLHACRDLAILLPFIWLFRYSHSDVNGDGMVDEADFNIVCSNWSPGGEDCPDRPPWIQ